MEEGDKMKLWLPPKDFFGQPDFSFLVPLTEWIVAQQRAYERTLLENLINLEKVLAIQQLDTALKRGTLSKGDLIQRLAPRPRAGGAHWQPWYDKAHERIRLQGMKHKQAFEQMLSEEKIVIQDAQDYYDRKMAFAAAMKRRNKRLRP